MRLDGVDFPPRLTEALEKDELVVFAGAGVSMGTPANLPDFEGLTTTIAAGTGEARQENEPVDRFLGRLESAGTEVHERAADALESAREPTALHRDLLRLYRAPQSVRLVTTNFDALFKQAAADVFDPAPSVFTAPALPLGGSFSGIVHVHGDLGEPRSMVLTDTDFGRAYLTEGWATRFLNDLFQKYTVLFVGYSHSDIVMSYLARALPRGAGGRFALTDEPDNARWQLLDIEPIGYDNRDNHSQLAAGVRRLADYRRRGLLDWQRDIAEIAKGPPPLDGEEADLIADAVSDPERCRFFTDVARHADWIGWLDQRGYLAALFGTAELIECDKRLAWWLAERFVRSHADHLFVLIGRNGLQVHPEFWRELARVIWAKDDDHPLDATRLGQWVSLLLATESRGLDTTLVLLWLGERCAEAGLVDALLDIFDAITAGGLEIKPRFALGGAHDTGPAVKVGTQRRQVAPVLVKGLYEDHLKPNLQEAAESLLERAVRRLADRHLTLQAWREATRDDDAMSFHRSAIEPHEQDDHPQVIDVLIDAARDALDHLVVTRPDAGASWCDRLVEAEAPLLRRLAVHALPMRADLNADAKVGWLLSHVGLYDRETHHETFLAIRDSYPVASAQQRQASIDAIREYEWPNRDDDWERYTAYQHFARLQWLSDSDPECDLAKEALESIRQRYPDFQPSDHPDFTHYHSVSWGGWGDREGSESPWSVEELLSRPAGEWLPQLLSFHDKDPSGPSRDGLLRTVGEAAGRDFEWGLALANALAESEGWDSDLWATLLRSWSSELDEDKHRRVLARLDDVELHRRQIRATAEMLLHLVKDGGHPYAPALLEESNRLARSLWAHCGQGIGGPVSDWLTVAITHPAGWIAEYWIRSLSLWRNSHDPRPEAMDAEYSSALLQVINEPGGGGSLGRAVLARSLGFLLAADEPWTREHLVPLFEDAGGDDYPAVWDGLLYGRMDRNVITAMEDATFAAIHHMSDLFPDQGQRRELLIQLCTAVVTYCVDDPLDAWVPQFFKAADDSDKRLFALSLGNRIREADDAGQRELWNRWLGQYWENRLQGVPAPLSNDETAAMVGWLSEFQSLFPEAVDLAVKMPKAPLDEGWLVLHAVGKGDQWSAYPEATLRLLLHVAEHDTYGLFWHEAQPLVDKLFGLDLSGGAATQLDELRAKHSPS